MAIIHLKCYTCLLSASEVQTKACEVLLSLKTMPRKEEGSQKQNPTYLVQIIKECQWQFLE